MLEDHRYAFARLGHALAFDQDLALLVGNQSVDASEKGRLAAAGRPDDGHDLAVADRKIDVAKDLQRAVALADPPDCDAVPNVPLLRRLNLPRTLDRFLSLGDSRKKI